MKNFLVSILTIFLSFFITFFLLNQSNTKSNFFSSNAKSEVKESVGTADAQEDDTYQEDENEISEENEISNSTIDVAESESLDFSDTLADYGTWNDYNKENIDLATEFIAVDVQGSEITKKEFLEKLKTGNYIPIKLQEAEYMYQLYRINSGADKKISKSIKTSSDIAYSYFLRENEAFPEFSFKDLNGNLYTNENTIGNILVIECWFIQCTTCIQEFPIINDLYDRYEGHDDIIFLSLAFDKAKKLKTFLSKKEFRYPVVPDKKDFIKNEIKVIQYPTHLIIDQYGNITKMVSNVDSLILALDTMVNGNLLEDETNI